MKLGREQQKLYNINEGAATHARVVSVLRTYNKANSHTVRSSNVALLTLISVRTEISLKMQGKY